MSRNQMYYSDRHRDDCYVYSRIANGLLPAGVFCCSAFGGSTGPVLVWRISLRRRRSSKNNASLHVLTREIAKYVPSLRLMSEDEWRQLGVQQSQG